MARARCAASVSQHLGRYVGRQLLLISDDHARMGKCSIPAARSPRCEACRCRFDYEPRGTVINVIQPHRSHSIMHNAI